MTEISLELKISQKTFDTEGVLKGIDLSVKKGSSHLLGASGCGKTTTLQHHRRSGESGFSRVFLGGRGRDGQGAEQEGCKHGVSELCAVPPYDCGGKCEAMA